MYGLRRGEEDVQGDSVYAKDGSCARGYSAANRSRY